MTIRSAARLAILVVLASTASVAQTEKPHLEWPASLEALKGKQRVLMNYSKDFISFAKANQDENEVEMLLDLTAISNEAYDQIDMTTMLLDIHDDMTCDDDRKIIESHLKKEVQFAIKHVDLYIDRINSDASQTKLPAVSQTAIRMKDDLREVRTKLDALRSSLE